jgi:hypothetical protein
VQVRVTLLAAADGASPTVRGVHLTLDRSARFFREDLLQPAAGPPTARIWATREGLVGRTTANGHVIGEHDHFVALPSKRVLNAAGANDYMVRISYRGRTVVAPVWDIGPWNITDDYWNDNREQFRDLPRWTSESEAAFFSGYNGGKDSFGRLVTLPTSLDIADGTFLDDLGMTANDWVDVTYLWLNAPSPPARPTPVVVPKTAPGGNPGAIPPLAPRAASYNVPSPSSQVYLPLIMQDASGWTTTMTIQNPTGTPAYVQADLANTAGLRVGSLPLALPPWGSQTLMPREVVGVTAGFVGSASLSASVPITVVVNQDRDGFNRAAYAGFGSGAATLAAPLVFRAYNGWSTGIQVQNLGASPATVTVTYTGTGVQGSAGDAAVIPPLASASFYQPASRALADGFVGSAMVRSLGGQPIAAVVNEVRADGSAMSYPGIAGGTDSLQAPLLFKHYNGWDTGIQLLNLSPTSALAMVSYSGAVADSTQAIDMAMLPPGRPITLYQPAQLLLPDGFVGSASIDSAGAGKLVGLVNEVRAGTTAAMSYVVGLAPATSLAAPLVMKGYGGWDTGVQVQNGGDAATLLQVSFYDELGVVVLRIQETVRAGATQTYYPPAIPALPEGFRGSVVVQSTNGQPLTAIVNQTTR